MGIRIHQLPEIIANQIAAGEVIERPASVVKELLENALDAQANQIVIEIGFGGLNHIKVSDNGIGIDADDLPLAIAAHATSKISQLSDLYAIQSLGFRGEALASIASVSKLTIRSKPARQDNAMMLTFQMPQGMALSPCARNQGTTIEVNDIFYNAPVRKRFLKSDKSEFQAIEGVVRRFAMSAPWVAIELKHNDKSLWALPPALTDKLTLARISKLLGKDFVAQALPLDWEHGGLRLQGWVGHPDYQRNQLDKQWVYINGRMVKDKLIHHAIKQAYESVLHPGKYPACLLYLTLSPENVDVNVHPTKHEVRFQQPRFVHDFFVTALQQCISQVEAPVVAPVEIKRVLRPERRPGLVSQWADRENRDLPLQPARWVEIIPIDDQQVLILLNQNQQVYLANWPALQEAWLHQQINAQLKPMASRPLLVPIGYKPVNVLPVMPAVYTRLLGALGLNIVWRDNQDFMLQTLPIITPDLDVKAFLSAVFDLPEPDERTVIRILLRGLRFSNQDKSHPQWPEFMNYLCEHLDQSSAHCRLLSPSYCRELLHV